ncbi:hypothetical protein HYH03_008669 [Edaphochlamys debaryana]|uniref:LysM domain-containing protein n=1 Tax=Edaphochlamys debaryana TaxID=47281 RepID=A0A835XZQ7_9CHLO|nr:hypothetical protein HYH03_008669 [Edaphochlamys debaryana]|eukprot:KAG2493005.1 hypothetical protein HYH03_008669 [Edaphochlamys debaryana]
MLSALGSPPAKATLTGGAKPVASPVHGHTPIRARQGLWVTQAAAEAEIGTLHTVQTGETLAQIALAYGVSVEQIQEAIPKNSRSGRTVLRSTTTLQPGQKLLVPSTHTTPAPGPLEVAGDLARQNSPIILGALGTAVLAAGALRLLTRKAPETPTAAVAEAPADAPAAAGSPAGAAKVTSAVAEVRALLQDAAVEMQAVEAALAAVRRAAASAPAPVAAAAAVAVAVPAVAAAAVEAPAQEAAAGMAAAEGTVAEVSAAVAEAAPAAEAVATVAEAVAEAAPAEAAVEAAAAEAPAVQAEAEAVTEEPVEPDLSGFDTAAQVAAARARVSSALEAAREVIASVQPAPAAEVEVAAAVTAPAVAVVAAAEAEVDTLPGVMAEAMQMLNQPVSSEMAGAVLERIRVINRLLEQEQARAEAAEARRPALEVEAVAPPAVESQVAEAPAAEAVTAEAPAAEALAAEAPAAEVPVAEAPAAEAPAAEAPAMEAAAAEAPAETEAPAAEAAAAEVPAAEAEVPVSTAAAAVAAALSSLDASTTATAAALKSVDGPTTAMAAALRSVDGATSSPVVSVDDATSPAAVTVDAVYEPPSEEVVASLSDKAGGLLDSIDRLLASFEGLSDTDEAALDEMLGKTAAAQAAAVAAEAEAEAAPAAPAAAADQLLPPDTAVAPAPLPLASVDSTTTANLKLNLPPIPGLAAAEAAAEAAEAVTAAAVASASASVAERQRAVGAAVEAMLGPLQSAGVPLPVLDRVKRMLQEEHVTGEADEQAAERKAAAAASAAAGLVAEEAAAVAQPVAAAAVEAVEAVAGTLTGALDAVAGAASAASASVTATSAAAAEAAGSVPAAIIDTLNRTFRAPSPPPVLDTSFSDFPGSPAASPSASPKLFAVPRSPGLLAAPPEYPALPAPAEPAAPAKSLTAAAESTAATPAVDAPLNSLAEVPPASTLPPSQQSPLPPSQGGPPGQPHNNPLLQRAVQAAHVATTGGGGGNGDREDEESRRGFADASADATLVNLKSGLLDLVYGTARGVSATPVQRAGIEEFITALEARNPNTMPTEPQAMSALSGRWKLVYTSNVATLMLLGALDSMPLVDVGDVYQVVDPVTLNTTNKIDIAVPMMLSLRADAGLEVRSPRQFKVQFTKVGLDTYVATPQIMTALEVPDSITVLGARLDMTPVKRLLEPINSGLEAAQGLLGRAVSPEFGLGQVPTPPGFAPGLVTEATSLWMLTTYLDDTLRISRDDEGRVFVMLKDVGIYPEDVARMPR